VNGDMHTVAHIKQLHIKQLSKQLPYVQVKDAAIYKTLIFVSCI